MKQLKKGFTLIEILVVIGIIAVLAAIVIVAINPARQFAQARDTQRTSDASAISNAIGQYLSDHKGIATTTSAGAPIITSADSDASVLCSDLIPTYMAALPVDPKESNPTSITSCPAAYSTNYKVATTTGNRVIVKAPAAEITTPITVTR